MLYLDDDIRSLTQIGFTEAQAKLYLALLSIGKTDAKNLSKQADVPRQAAYRTLGELQEKGLVERIISLPQEYRAIPLHDGLAVMIRLKAKEYTQIMDNAKEFLQRYNVQQEQTPSDEEFSISIIEGKETIIRKSRHATDLTKTEICIFSTFQRWTHTKMELCDTVEKALKRGVKYRVIIEKPSSDFFFSKEFKSVLTHPNYDIRLATGKLKVNASLFDDKEACFSFYPSKAIAETPMVWTNHPSLLIGFRDHFENLWSSTERIDLRTKMK
jgi:HTH-type transcriptional regulator, sugar sensing transcriptional regulator